MTYLQRQSTRRAPQRSPIPGTNQISNSAGGFADHRRASGIDARLVEVGTVSNGFSIADPNDPGQLDVVGFDTATPALISDFARGAL